MAGSAGKSGRGRIASIGVEGTPLKRYEQTSRLVERYIVDNKLEPGDKLPTEAEIGELAGVSLITVRRAMAELVQRGVVRREQGRGTFVQAIRIDTETTRLGSLRETLGGDRSLTTEVLSVTRRAPDETERTALQLGPGALIWDVERLRRIDGHPMIVELAAVPEALAPHLDKEVRRSRDASLYHLLAEHYGLDEGHEEQTLVVRRPDTPTRERLDLASGELVVAVSGTSFTLAGVPFDAFRLTFDARRFTFHLRSTPQTALVALTDGHLTQGARR